MVLMLQIIIDLVVDKLLLSELWIAQISESIFSFISMLLGWWIVIYIFLAMKRFYRQGWGMTISKSLALGFIYLMMLTFGFMMTIAAGAYQA